MGLLFKSDFHDGFGSWPLAYIPYGGIDFGEILGIAQAVGDGSDSAFYEAWVAAGDRFATEAADTLAKGRQAVARELFLKASECYATAKHPVFGFPVDPRRFAAFRKETAAFDQAMALSKKPVTPRRIPFEKGSLPSLADGVRRAALDLVGASPEAVADLGTMDQQLLDRLWYTISNNRQLSWSIVQRGFWVNGTKDLRAYLTSLELYTMNGRESWIRCPTLLTMAQNDTLSAVAKIFCESLTCPKTLLSFSADRGAGDHCEMKNRTLLNRYILDWLDEAMV